MDVRQILYPTDFSPLAGSAFPLALRCAQAFAAPLHLLHALSPQGLTASPGDAGERAAEHALAQLRELAAVAEEAGAPVVITQRRVDTTQGILGEVVVRVGEPGSEILRMANSGGVDLVVMGSHGVAGIKRVLFGSTAEEVLRGAVPPVLVVPPALVEGAGRGRARPARRRAVRGR